MKIIVINNRADRVGGADVVAINTAELLSLNGHDVVYYSTGSELVKNNQIKFYSIKKSARFFNYLYSIKVFISLFRLLKNERPDIAHLHNYHGYLTYSILHALKLLRIPVVVTLHDYKLICPIQSSLAPGNVTCMDCKGGGFYNCVIKKCYKLSIFGSLYKSIEAYLFKYVIGYFNCVTKYICVSQFSYNHHVLLFGAAKFVMLHNFIPEYSQFEIPRSNTVLYFGRLSAEKGILELLEVWKKLKKSSFRLEIMGNGPLSSEIKNLISDDSSISYIGHLNSYNQIANKIASSRFVIVPSRWFENNPLTILESFSNSTPVIASRIGGIPELISDNVDGFLFNPYEQSDFIDTLSRALSLGDVDYSRLANNARQKYINKFSPQLHYRNLLEIYKDCIKLY